MATSILITAVNTGTSTITAPAHGLNTGDGPLDVRNLGGLLPAPLAGVTQYWAIKIDANNIQVADSNAHALTSTFIPLTTSGTGKNFLEYGIPYRRKTTYAAATQVKSVDLNALQDALVALHDMFTGQAQSVFKGQTVTRNRFPTILGTATGWLYGTAGAPTLSPAFANTAAGTLTVDLDVPQGFALSQLTFALAADVASPGGALTVTLLKAGTRSTTVPSVLGTYTVANGSFPTVAADQVINFMAASPGITVTVAAAGGTYTRSAGSFITDGHFIGEVVQWSGFVNGGNNALKTITALSATVMTVSNTGLVNETGPTLGATVGGVSPTVDDTFGLQLSFAGLASAHTIWVGMPRYTLVTP